MLLSASAGMLAVTVVVGIFYFIRCCTPLGAWAGLCAHALIAKVMRTQLQSTLHQRCCWLGIQSESVSKQVHTSSQLVCPAACWFWQHEELDTLHMPAELPRARPCPVLTGALYILALTSLFELPACILLPTRVHASLA